MPEAGFCLLSSILKDGQLSFLLGSKFGQVGLESEAALRVGGLERGVCHYSGGVVDGVGADGFMVNAEVLVGAGEHGG